MKYHILLFVFVTQSLFSQTILTLRDRASLINEIQKDRIENLLPKLMEEQNLDLWVLITREYNEDPVVKTLLPPTWLNARRRTILVFYRNKAANTIEKLAVARYDVGENIQSAWNKEEQPEQWERLVEIIKERNPDKIGINTSKHFGIADGLVQTDYRELLEALPEDLENKLKDKE